MGFRKCSSLVLKHWATVLTQLFHLHCCSCAERIHTKSHYRWITLDLLICCTINFHRICSLSRLHYGMRLKILSSGVLAVVCTSLGFKLCQIWWVTELWSCSSFAGLCCSLYGLSSPGIVNNTPVFIYPTLSLCKFIIHLQNLCIWTIVLKLAWHLRSIQHVLT